MSSPALFFGLDGLTVVDDQTPEGVARLRPLGRVLGSPAYMTDCPGFPGGYPLPEALAILARWAR